MTDRNTTHQDDKFATDFRFHDEGLMNDLGQMLVERGLLTREQLHDADTRRMLSGVSLDKLLLREHLVPEAELSSLLSEISGIPFHPIADFDIAQDAIAMIPARLALRYHCMPIACRDDLLLIAVSHVPDHAMVDSLRLLLSCSLGWVLCADDDITKSIKHFYGLGINAVDTLIQTRESSADDIQIDETDLSSVETADPGVLQFVNQIIAEAISMDATDIHMEPFEKNIRLRYRIDGVLQEIPIPKGIQRLQRALASCVKIMAQLNIAERRKPHDGRIKVRLKNEEFDLRVSVLPTRFGETVNMRILNRKSMFIDLEEMGLTQEQWRMFQYLSSIPHGILLITGPTGSGKTTTLYALLSRLNTHEVKIITAEDPVEYQMEGINQIQVNPQIGLTFADVLRSILRHDPDIILVGEIRDSETADMAVRASLTGHLVCSTLHTNDAPSSIMRLVDMGIEPYLVSSCLEGIVAQRLVRRLCSACRTQTQPDDIVIEEAAQLWPDTASSATYYAAHGCPHCNFTGYRGRIALFEIMIMNDKIRAMVVRQKSSSEIRKAALDMGLETLRKSGFRQIIEGKTTIEEVMRVARRFQFEQSPS